MPKIEITKKEKIGYIIRSVYVNCPYCSETNYVSKDNDVFVEGETLRFLCRFCKFSFVVEEIK